ncbi:related to NIPSNAP protein [Ustilago trichophora]|uniref:Related to NIPSNAP protein n=1 Tax=Ustilago trichophora TaxID=86804 RepID=A0A5C3ELX7_9BASI|nr:related to NIPSNAP protein [Ustilago trichophora]
MTASLAGRGLRTATRGWSTRTLTPSATTLVASRSLIIPSRPLSAEQNGATSQQQPEQDGQQPKQSLLKSLLHGSDKAKAEGVTQQSHSMQVARGKYIHEIQRQSVSPAHSDEYRSLIAQYFPKLAEKGLPMRLTGSWEVIVGDLETFYHIWEYDGYAGYDKAESALRSDPDFQELTRRIRPLLSNRSNWLTQEFSFWPSSPPRTTNGLYELRTYHLKPGHLLEWEQHWRRGLEARRKFVEPIGAWFTQIGGLHTVFHIWEYPSLEERKRTRDLAWQVETWNDTVSQTVKLIDKMHAQIMRPLPFSPLK